MQIAISGHWSQSMGAGLSGQQGMSADISAAIGAALAAPAGAESGAKTSPAIKKIASSRPKWIEMFTAGILSRSSRNGNLGWITNSPESGMTNALMHAVMLGRSIRCVSSQFLILLHLVRGEDLCRFEMVFEVRVSQFGLRHADIDD